MLQYITLLVILTYILYRIVTPRKPPNFPPGPRNYPLAGGAWILRKLDSNFIKALLKLKELYGPITGIYLGQTRAIVVNGFDAVKEVLSRDEFQGRPEIFINRFMHGHRRKLGIIFAEGPMLKEQRRFTLRHLRDFGFGKSSLETFVHQEIEELMTRLRNKCRDTPVIRLDDLFGPPVINVLWVVLSGKRMQHDDPSFRRLLQLLSKLFRSGNQGGSIIQDWPLLRFIPPFSTQFKEMMEGKRAIVDMLNEEIQTHESTMDSSYSRDFIDLYLKEIDKHMENGDESHFTKEQLLVICSDLFSAGAESTSNSIAFGLLYMILYPQVQERVQEELDRVVGRGRLPSYSTDGQSLPYTTAVLCELLRISSIAPLTVPHSTLEGTQLFGYDIPKDTFTLISLASVHMDQEFWGDPEVFKPQRFLDNANMVVKTERLMGFGYGKRACLGEVLARMNTFGFFTSMLQNFKIQLAPGREKPTTVPLDGFTVAPKAFFAKLECR